MLYLVWFSLVVHDPSRGPDQEVSPKNMAVSSRVGVRRRPKPHGMGQVG